MSSRGRGGVVWLLLGVLVWVVLGGSALGLLGMGLMLAVERGSLEVHVFSVVMIVGGVSCSSTLSRLHHVLRVATGKVLVSE